MKNIFIKKFLELIEKQGLNPLHEILENLDGWPVLVKESWNEKKFDWKKTIYKLRKMGHSINYLIQFNLDVNLKNNKYYEIYVSTRQ